MMTWSDSLWKVALVAVRILHTKGVRLDSGMGRVNVVRIQAPEASGRD